MKRRNVPILPFVCELNSTAKLDGAMERVAPSLEFLPDAMVLEAEWRTNPALAQQLEEDRAQQSSRAPGAIFLRQARFALVAAKINSRKKRITHSRYEFSCAGLRAHVKEAPRCDSKRHDRAAIGVIARVAPESVVRMCGRSSKQPEIGRAIRWRVLPGQNNIPFCSAENAWANHSKDSYRFDDRLAFLAAMGGAAFALERQRSKISKIENRK